MDQSDAGAQGWGRVGGAGDQDHLEAPGRPLLRHHRVPRAGAAEVRDQTRTAAMGDHRAVRREDCQLETAASVVALAR